MDLELHQQRLHELKATTQIGLETVREFWY